MRSRTISTERLFGVSTRLLAGASVLSTIGLVLGVRLAWRQTGQSYGVDGPIDDLAMPFAQRLILAMFDLSYRQVAVQLLISSVLVGAAVVALDRNPSWAQVRLIRWEVLVAGLVTLVPVVGLVLANLYVMTASDDAAGDAADYMGPHSLNELTIVSLMPLVAAGLVLAVAALWWLRLEPAPDGTDDDADDDIDDTDDDTDDDTGADPDVPVEQKTAVSLAVPAQVPRDSSDSPGSAAALGYPQDWSPEDFRRPSA